MNDEIITLWTHERGSPKVGSDATGGGRVGDLRIFMKTPFRLKETCKMLPGARWHPEAKAWHVPATTASAHAIATAFKGEKLHMDDETRSLFDSARRQLDAQHLKDATDLPQPPVRTPAWLHQRRAFAFAKELDAAMLSMAMGAGKSLAAIALLEEWDAQNVLILCPVSVIDVWPSQFERHSMNPDDWFIVAPQNRLKVDARAEQIADGIVKSKRLGKRSVSVVNYEAAWRPRFKILIQAIDWDVIIADESHRLKSAGGRTSLFVSGLRKNSRRRLALTGTPMPHSPLDIYAQYRFLDPGIFGTSKSRFQNRYAIMGGFENRQVQGWQNQEELTKKFSSIAFIVSKEEALPDLPRAVYVERTFDLGPKALTAYVRMSEDFLAAVEEGVIVATNALSRLLRLRQITSGHSRTDEGGLVVLDDSREKLLQDVLSDLPADEPVVVFSVFHPDLDATERVAERLGLRYGELSGRRRDGLNSSAQMSEDIDVLGAQLASGSVGIDLTRAAYAVYYSVGFSLGEFDQSLARLDRPGQVRSVTYIHLLAKGTVDQTVYRALNAKKSVVDAVLNAAKEGGFD